MPGYRSGFVAGDPEVIAALKRYRPNVGIAPQEFVQRARGRGLGRRGARRGDAGRLPRQARRAAARARGRAACAHAGGDATFFLWLDAGPEADALAARAARGAASSLAPGSFFGPAGEGYVRLALVPPLAACERAASSSRRAAS